MSLLEITDKSLKDRLLATAFVEAEPIEALKLKANFGMDLNYMKRQTYLPKLLCMDKRGRKCGCVSL